MATAPDDASVSSADDSILIMAQTHDAILPPQRKPYADAVLTQVAVSGPSPPRSCAGHFSARLPPHQLGSPITR